MGSGYNDSLALSRNARGKASTRTPIHFYLSVPVYEYDLGCGRNAHLHTFQTRTPFITDDEEVIVWCNGCQKYRKIDPEIEPLNHPTSTDELVAFEQDKGILRERIAMHLQDIGFVDNEKDIAVLAVEHGVQVSEIKRINAGLKAPDGLSGLPDMCSKGLHEMTIENIMVSGGRRQCKACYNIARRANRARKRSGTAPPSHN